MKIPAYYKGYKVPDEFRMDGGNSLLFRGWQRGLDQALEEGRKVRQWVWAPNPPSDQMVAAADVCFSQTLSMSDAIEAALDACLGPLPDNIWDD
jgi:hypothetical protein